MLLRPPILSAYDPEDRGEGSIDPLSLARTYERLADRIYPSITARMSRIRFLTAIAVGAHVCADLEPEGDDADKVRPPWMAFEWLVIEAFARNRERIRDERRIAGIDKVRTAVDRGHQVSAATYLKTPTVFGITGIFRRLATGVRVLIGDHRLDDNGYRLLRAWERDCGLAGFISGAGEGAQLREELRRAVWDGLRKGHTPVRTRQFWQRLCEALHPGGARRHEREVLESLLLSTDSPREASIDAEAPLHRKALVEAIREHGRTLQRDDEPAFFTRLERRGASPSLAQRLRAIRLYESLCRPLRDAFDLVRHLSTARQCTPVDPSDFAHHELATPTWRILRDAALAILDDDTLRRWEPDAVPVAERFASVGTPRELFEVVLAHHEEAQRRKPPDGKRSWLDRAPHGQVAVRPGYGVLEPPMPASGPALFLHDYRTATVSRFLKDLRRVR